MFKGNQIYERFEVQDRLVCNDVSVNSIFSTVFLQAQRAAPDYDFVSLRNLPLRMRFL
jgi:hypothetical protein